MEFTAKKITAFFGATIMVGVFNLSLLHAGGLVLDRHGNTVSYHGSNPSIMGQSIKIIENGFIPDGQNPGFRMKFSYMDFNSDGATLRGRAETTVEISCENLIFTRDAAAQSINHSCSPQSTLTQVLWKKGSSEILARRTLTNKVASVSINEVHGLPIQGWIDINIPGDQYSPQVRYSFEFLGKRIYDPVGVLGDFNNDGCFNSTDLVLGFQNPSLLDMNGDGETSDDLVRLFQEGHYEKCN